MKKEEMPISEYKHDPRSPLGQAVKKFAENDANIETHLEKFGTEVKDGDIQRVLAQSGEHGQDTDFTDADIDRAFAELPPEITTKTEPPNQEHGQNDTDDDDGDGDGDISKAA